MPKHRVLIISPHFPPINAADHQRVRMSLPYLEQFGWKPHLLTVSPEYVEGVRDLLLSKTIPEHIPITWIKALPFQQTKRFGVGGLGLRCYLSLLRAGDRLLKQNKFDLVYFSTTVFNTMALGARWYRLFKIPYVLDFQDPWITDYYEKFGVAPPGGWFKYKFAQLQAKILQPRAVSKVSHIISVSPTYPLILQRQYTHLKSEQFTVLPFGAPEKDFQQLSFLNIKQKIFDRNDGKRHWVYVGRGGDDMALALRILFLGIQLARQQNPQSWQSVKLHFVGTSYATDNRAVKTVEPIAQELKVADLVEEYPHRIPYFEAMQTMTDSDGILLIGSDDFSYTASKLYPCILARRPILAIFHQNSSVVDILNHCRAGRTVTFKTGERPENLLPAIIPELQDLLSTPKGYQPDTDWKAFQPYTAKEMTRKQCQVFERSLNLRRT